MSVRKAVGPAEQRRGERRGAPPGRKGRAVVLESKTEGSGELAPFAEIAPAALDSPAWPVHPGLWIGPDPQVSAPRTSGLRVERRHRIPARGFCAAPEPLAGCLAVSFDEHWAAPDCRLLFPRTGLTPAGWDPRGVCGAGIPDVSKTRNAQDPANIDMNRSAKECMVQAACLHVAGKTEEALAALREAREAGDPSPDLLSAIGLLEFELSHYEAAADAYAELAYREAAHPTAHFNLGVCYERLEKWEQAAASFKKAIEIEPRRAGAQLGLGVALLHLDQPRNALDVFDICLARQPFREEALEGKAAALALLGSHLEALEIVHSLRRRYPNSPQLLANSMAISMRQADYESLSECARAMLQIREGDQTALECLAMAASARRNHEEAANWCTELTRMRPENFAAWFNLGISWRKLSRYEDAAAAFGQAAKLNEAAEAYVGAGAALQEMERWAAATEAYEKALSSEPEFREALWNLAVLSEQQRDLDRAEELYARIVELYPEDADACFRLGYVRMGRGAFAEAIPAFEACTALQPQHREALLNLGIAHWKAANRDAAQATFRTLLAAVPRNPEALRSMAAMAAEDQDFKQALALYRQLLEAGDPSAELLYDTGLALQRLGRPKDAVGYYRQALAAKPDMASALLNLGHALMALGEHEQAHASWQAAIQIDNNLAVEFLV